MKNIEKQWFIERIKPYLMPGESIREGTGCVIFRTHNEDKNRAYQGNTLWIHSPGSLVIPRHNAVCHLETNGSTCGFIRALTLPRFGKDAKEKLLADFLTISGLKDRDLEACRKARTRKKLIAAFCSSITTRALREAGHTTLPNEVSSDEMLEQMRTAHGLVCGNIYDGAFMCGMAFALGKPTYYEDSGSLNELLEALDK